MTVLEREALDAELDRLAAMLPDWRVHRQASLLFAAQFVALADAILARVREDDLAHARDRLAGMLEHDERVAVARERGQLPSDIGGGGHAEDAAGAAGQAHPE